MLPVYHFNTAEYAKDIHSSSQLMTSRLFTANRITDHHSSSQLRAIISLSHVFLWSMRLERDRLYGSIYLPSYLHVLTCLQKNGALLGAISLYHTSFPVSTELYEALDLDLTHGKRPDAYSKRSQTLQHYSHGLKAFSTPSRLDIQEAAGIFDVWIKDRALHTSKQIP